MQSLGVAYGGPNVSQTLTFNPDTKPFNLFSRTMEQSMADGYLRKRRDASDKRPQYVWTNVELEWEEHHYIEARYWQIAVS